MNPDQVSVKPVTLAAVEILDSAGEAVYAVSPSKSYVIAITVSSREPVENVSVGYNIKLANGVVVYGTSSAIQGRFFNLTAGDPKVVRFSFNPNLTLGTYYLSAGAAETLTPEDEVHNYVMLDFIHDAAPFVVAAKPKSSLSKMEVRLVSLGLEEAR